MGEFLTSQERGSRLVVVCFFLLLTTLKAQAYTPADCVGCHGEKNDKSRLQIDVITYETSVHAAGFTCLDCHRQITSDQHISRTGAGTVACTNCHQQRNHHGGFASKQTRPDCQQCHTRHRIFRKTDPAASIHPDRITETCRQCHPQESGQTTYLSWLASIRVETHNKQNLANDYSMNNCLGCHQGQAAHGETAGVGSQSCSACHLTPDGKNALLGVMHPKADPDKQLAVFAASIFYQFVLVYFLWFGWRKIIDSQSRSNRGKKQR